MPKYIYANTNIGQTLYKHLLAGPLPQGKILCLTFGRGNKNGKKIVKSEKWEFIVPSPQIRLYCKCGEKWSWNTKVGRRLQPSWALQRQVNVSCYFIAFTKRIKVEAEFCNKNFGFRDMWYNFYLQMVFSIYVDLCKFVVMNLEITWQASVKCQEVWINICLFHQTQIYCK